jgi:hypothetical protein
MAGRIDLWGLGLNGMDQAQGFVSA